MAGQEERLAALILATPDATLVELREALATTAALSTVWREIDRLGLTAKKTAHADEQRRPDVAAARRRWHETFPVGVARQYVCVDESGVTTDLIRRYARSACGTRIGDHTPCSHWQTDPHGHRGAAAHGADGPGRLRRPIDNDTFPASIDQILVPTLRPGDVVVFDNLTRHKLPEVRQAIEQAGARLRFLPPYSPDFNLIEQAFAKLKALLRRARPRSFDEICARIAAALRLFQPDECANYARNCGYRLTGRRRGDRGTP